MLFSLTLSTSIIVDSKPLLIYSDSNSTYLNSIRGFARSLIAVCSFDRASAPIIASIATSIPTAMIAPATPDATPAPPPAGQAT